LKPGERVASKLLLDEVRRVQPFHEMMDGVLHKYTATLLTECAARIEELEAAITRLASMAPLDTYSLERELNARIEYARRVRDARQGGAQT